MTLYIRFRYDDDNSINVCPHIKLFCTNQTDDEDCEYESRVKIYCNICIRNFEFTECIN